MSINKLQAISPVGHDQNSTQAMFAQLPLLISSQDRQHRFTGVSSLVSTLCGFKDAEQMIGLRNADLPCDIAQHAQVFDAQAEDVFKTGKTKQYFGIFGRYHDNNARILLYDKSPVYSEQNEVEGVVCHAMELKQGHLKQISSSLMLDNTFYTNSSACHYYQIIDEADDLAFTPRELECLFYILRGKSGSQISGLLHISARTVEFHLANLKLKLDVYNKSQLIEKAISLGYLFKVPKSLL